MLLWEELDYIYALVDYALNFQKIIYSSSIRRIITKCMVIDIFIIHLSKLMKI